MNDRDGQCLMLLFVFCTLFLVNLLTPAKFSDSPNLSEMVDRLGQKKSEATMPTNENRNPSQMIRSRMVNGLECSIKL
jgi:hypothetical protein